jgi:hypothetical protein
MKTCSKCAIIKEETSFYTRGDGSGLLCSWCKDCNRECAKELRHRNRRMGLCRCGRVKITGKQHCEHCRQLAARTTKRRSGAQRKNLRKTRNEAIAAYGGKCRCCSESEFLYLQFHHVNGDGATHRKAIGGNSFLLWWLKKNNYPPSIELLCANCHAAITAVGYCPHKQRLEVVA